MSSEKRQKLISLPTKATSPCPVKKRSIEGGRKKEKKETSWITQEVAFLHFECDWQTEEAWKRLVNQELCGDDHLHVARISEPGKELEVILASLTFWHHWGSRQHLFCPRHGPLARRPSRPTHGPSKLLWRHVLLQQEAGDEWAKISTISQPGAASEREITNGWM